MYFLALIFLLPWLYSRNFDFILKIFSLYSHTFDFFSENIMTLFL